MKAFNIKELSDADIRTKFITPAIKDAGWDVLNQMREEVYFTAGRIIVRGKMVARGRHTSLKITLDERDPTPFTYRAANLPAGPF